MPILRVVTNLTARQVPVDFETGLPRVIGAVMNKEIGKFWLELVTDARMTLGGTRDPAAFITVRSIGCVSALETPNLTAKITGFCAEKLKLPNDRIGIHYFDLEPHCIARAGLTMKEQFEKSKQ
ncbi:unnamed protein product, partial [Mesorhabditis belari]|uniref:Uncharacterized protein n=1 Tax=Mesorhabditis belari TaxID=2138241 RepID=A0AAF3FP81_9BILA